MNAAKITNDLKKEARRVGFDMVGVCAAVAPPRIDRFRQWLIAGYAGEMHYLPRRANAYEHPRFVMDGARSVVMLAMNYRTDAPAATTPGQGRVSRYAWGAKDYHDIIHDRLHKLSQFVIELAPGAKVRGVVDTAPLLERDFAQLAGLGWIGKNTLLLNKQAGSWFFLAALLTDIELVCDQPFESDHCGTCTACLDACPTDAFPMPYVLDATKCISYLTIELRDPIPPKLREGIGDWLFGCDVCQDVCPWNRHAPRSNEPSFVAHGSLNPIELIELFDLDEEAFRQRFRHTPLWRSKRRGILRNAAIVLGNHPSDKAVDALIRGLNDRESIVRSACAWALGHYAHAAARHALQTRLGNECDEQVRREISDAIAGRQSAKDTNCP